MTVVALAAARLSRVSRGVGIELPARAARGQAGVRSRAGHAGTRDAARRARGRHVNTLYARREHIDELAAVAAEKRVRARAGAARQDRGAVPGIPKTSLLGLYFRRAAIDGMTDPLFLEVIVNPDVLPMERPFVVAHEWAHLAGYAAEDEANFVAWLTCTEAAPAALATAAGS